MNEHDKIMFTLLKKWNVAENEVMQLTLLQPYSIAQMDYTVNYLYRTTGSDQFLP